MMIPVNHAMPGPDENRDAASVSLIIQDRLLIELMGGLFPERANDFRGITRVLDPACGPGTWAVSVARENPGIQVVARDHRRNLVEYARGQAQAQGVDNLQVALLTEKLTRLPFPDQQFDLVNAHFLFALLRAEEWPIFLQECWRVTRPGGYVRLTEPEWGLTTSSALEQLSRLFLHGLQQRGQSFSPDDRHLGIILHLSFFLEGAGWTEITRQAYVQEYGRGPQLPHDPSLRVELITRELRPVILEDGIATQQEVEELVRKAIEEVGHEDFCGLQFLLSVCGRKPAAS